METLNNGETMGVARGKINSNFTDLDSSRTLVFSTLAALTASAATGAGHIAVTRGRAASGDGGGGTWYWSTANESTNVTNDPEAGVYAPPDSAPTGASGSWVRLYYGPLHLRWFGDDGDAMQAAVDFAAYKMSLVNPSTSVLGMGVEILVSGSVDFADVTVTIPEHGIGISGEVGKGSEIKGNVQLFNVGDYTDAARTRKTTFKDLNMVANVKNNAVAAVKLYRANVTNFENVTFNDWHIDIDCYRASNTYINNSHFLNKLRTSQALAFVRLQGTDETDTTGETYTPGGGMHITNCEGSGSVTGGAGTGLYDTDHGILIMSVDGFYMQQSHISGCDSSLTIAPDATAENHVITDVFIRSNCYFDDPSLISANPVNMRIGGTVRESITMADATTSSSRYKNIHMADSYFRGAGEVKNNLVIEVTDGDSWWDGSNKLENITVQGMTMSDSTRQQIFASAGASGYIEAYEINVLGSNFGGGNSSGTGSEGAAVHLHAESARVSDNVVGAPAGASDYGVFVTVTDSGDDGANPSAMISGNDFSKGGDYDEEPARISQSSTSVGAMVIQSDNLYPGPGRTLKQQYKLTTTDATTTTAWSFAIPSGVAGAATITITGQKSDGTKAVAYQFYAGFRNNGTASSLSTGSTSFTGVRSWNPDSIATIPTATLSTNSLLAQVTGVAAETWYWSCVVDMSTSN